MDIINGWRKNCLTRFVRSYDRPAAYLFGADLLRNRFKHVEHHELHQHVQRVPNAEQHVVPSGRVCASGNCDGVERVRGDEPCGASPVDCSAEEVSLPDGDLLQT